MPDTYKHSKFAYWLASVVAVACLFGTACSSEPAGPAQGTPEWYLDAARDNYAIPDFTKTVEQLKEATAAEGEAGAYAGVWRFVLTGGLALGYDTLADAYITGAEVTPAMLDEFQPSINEYRRRTRINAIAFAEGVGPVKNLVDAGETVMLDVPLPSGNGSVSPILASVEGGNRVDTQSAAMETQTLTAGSSPRCRPSPETWTSRNCPTRPRRGPSKFRPMWSRSVSRACCWTYPSCSTGRASTIPRSGNTS